MGNAISCPVKEAEVEERRLCVLSRVSTICLHCVGALRCNNKEAHLTPFINALQDIVVGGEVFELLVKFKINFSSAKAIRK